MKTPFLYLDYDKLKNNIDEMAALATANDTDLRPHCKSHKTVEIARLQMDCGASGITASTLKEVAMLLEAGIPSVTLAYPLVDRESVERYQLLSRLGELRTIVLDIEHACFLAEQFTFDRPLTAYLKVDTGLHRLGVQTSAVEEQVSRISELENIRLIGLLTHGGHSYKGLSPLSETAYEEAHGLLDNNSSRLVTSCGSTPTARELLKIPGVAELRPGNYVFYDRTMLSLGVAELEDCSLFLKTTVLANYTDHLVIDAGSKSLSSDAGVHGNTNIPGYGLILEDQSLVIERLSEEHGIVTGPGIKALKPGERLTILPNHACAMVNLFDEMNVFQNDTLIDSYKIRGRGH